MNITAQIQTNQSLNYYTATQKIASDGKHNVTFTLHMIHNKEHDNFYYRVKVSLTGQSYKGGYSNVNKPQVFEILFANKSTLPLKYIDKTFLSKKGEYNFFVDVNEEEFKNLAKLKAKSLTIKDSHTGISSIFKLKESEMFLQDMIKAIKAEYDKKESLVRTIIPTGNVYYFAYDSIMPYDELYDSQKQILDHFKDISKIEMYSSNSIIYLKNEKINSKVYDEFTNSRNCPRFQRETVRETIGGKEKYKFGRSLKIDGIKGKIYIMGEIKENNKIVIWLSSVDSGSSCGMLFEATVK